METFQVQKTKASEDQSERRQAQHVITPRTLIFKGEHCIQATADVNIIQ